MTMQLVPINSPEDIFQLPQGRLSFGEIDIGFSRELAFESAEVLIRHSDVDDLGSQAEAITRAGSRYGYGRNGAYRAVAGCEDSDRSLPSGKLSVVNLARPEDALRLVEGTLAIAALTIPFTEKEVLAAAQVLIDSKDIRALVSQAGVITRAGKHGFGKGSCYRSV